MTIVSPVVARELFELAEEAIRYGRREHGYAVTDGVLARVILDIGWPPEATVDLLRETRDPHSRHNKDVSDDVLTDARATEDALGTLKEWAFQDYWRDYGGNDHDAELAVAKIDEFRKLLRRNAPPQALPPAVPLESPDYAEADLEQALRWIVRGWFRPGWRHIIAGDSSAGKTFFQWCLIACAIKNAKFLGLDVDAKKFFFISNENTQLDFVAFMSARGITADELQRHVLFFGVEHNLNLSDPATAEAVKATIREFRPDMLFLDTILMVTSTQLHNDSVRDLFREVINPLKSEFPDMAIVCTHHVTKASGHDVTAKNMLGGAQFHNQIDAFISMATAGKYSATPAGDGVDTRQPLTLKRGKRRGGGEEVKLAIEFVGHKHGDDAGRLTSFEVREIETKKVTGENKVCAALVDGPLGSGALAVALGYTDHRSRGYRTLRDAAEANGLIEKNDAGDWRLT